MKKLLLLAAFVPFLVACSSSSSGEEEQDYTSFTVEIKANNDSRNCIAGYFKDDLCYKIADLGNLGNGKTSLEIIIHDEAICDYDIFVFGDTYDDLGKFGNTWRAGAFNIISMKKNRLLLDGHFNGISVSKDDPSEYPH